MISFKFIFISKFVFDSKKKKWITDWYLWIELIDPIELINQLNHFFRIDLIIEVLSEFKSFKPSGKHYKYPLKG